MDQPEIILQLNCYKGPNRMPPGKELDKKLFRQILGVEPESSKANETSMHKQDEATKTKSSEKGASVKPRPQKAEVRHATMVEHVLQKYQEELAELDEETEEEGEEGEEEEKEGANTTSHPRVSGRVKHSRKRTFKEAELSDANDSHSGTLIADESKRNVSYTGGQPNTRSKTSGSGKMRARESGSKTGGEGPSSGLVGSHRDTPQGPVNSLGKKK